ncbi:hypothetical protein AeMF1_008984 [Aphanomyces euteiches]|nr:hypothetical protein AeMF1_008984 [Aphanomyces euteiches]KAH9188565.1 hypothetical protein AeNC1_009454 [Aphanomyces euteiches]
MTQSLEETWLQDLQFLIATDDHLQEELANVCEILNSDEAITSPEAMTSSPTSSSTLDGSGSVEIQNERGYLPQEFAKVKPKPQRTAVRQREEILSLQKQIKEMTEILNADKSTVMVNYDISLWKQTARKELIAKNKALEENAYLRQAVGEHATFIEQMQRVFTKKPRLSTDIDIHSEEWQTYKLAAQASLREAAIHAIADRQYHRLQSAFVKANVFHRKEGLFHIKAIPQPDQSYVLEIVHHVELNAPFQVVVGAAWQVYQGNVPLDLPVGAEQTYTNLDQRTVYATYVEQRNGLSCHSNVIRKYYPEPDQEVIVSRTVLEDAAVPHMSKGAIQNRSEWLLVKPLRDDPNRSRFTLLEHLAWPRDEVVLEEKEIGIVLNQLESLCFGFKENRCGMLPATAAMDLSRLPFPTMSAFVERGYWFLDLLRTKLNDTIENYHR